MYRMLPTFHNDCGNSGLEIDAPIVEPENYAIDEVIGVHEQKVFVHVGEDCTSRLGGVVDAQSYPHLLDQRADQQPLLQYGLILLRNCASVGWYR